MKITNITNINEKAFQPFLFGTAKHASDQLLRIGITDEDHHVAGAAAAEACGAQLEMKSFYVVPECRRQGYGSALVKTIQTLADPEHYESLSVFCEGNPETVSFLEAMGFDVFEDVPQYCIPMEKLRHSPSFQRLITGRMPGMGQGEIAGKVSAKMLGKTTKGIVEISALDRVQKGLLHKYLEGSQLPEGEWYDPDWSTVGFNQNQVDSVMFNTPVEKGISVIWLHVKDARDPSAFLSHIRVLVMRMKQVYQDEEGTNLYFVAENQKFLSQLSNLIGRRNMKQVARMIRGVYLMDEKPEKE